MTHNKPTLLFILLLFFAAVSCKKTIISFSNVIELKNSPTSTTDEGLNKAGVSIRENYHPFSVEGLNAEHFSWSAAHLILLITE